MSTYRIQPHEDNPRLLDEVVMQNATVHLEQLDDSIFMLIVENAERHIHMRVGSRSNRAKVDAWIYEEYEVKAEERRQEFLRKVLRDMLIRDDGTLRYTEGPFRDGWQTAIEVMAKEIGVDYAAMEAEAEA